MNNKGADQTARAGLRLCCLQTPKTGFLASRPKWCSFTKDFSFVVSFHRPFVLLRVIWMMVLHYQELKWKSQGQPGSSENASLFSTGLTSKTSFDFLFHCYNAIRLL